MLRPAEIRLKFAVDMVQKSFISLRRCSLACGACGVCCVGVAWIWKLDVGVVLVGAWGDTVGVFVGAFTLGAAASALEAGVCATGSAGAVFATPAICCAGTAAR